MFHDSYSWLADAPGGLAIGLAVGFSETSWSHHA